MSNSSHSKQPGWSSPENLLTLFQTLALIAAGIWTIYLFFTFEQDERELQEALLRTQNLTTELAAERSKLDIQQAQMDLSAAAQGTLQINQRVEIEHLGPVEGDDQEHLFSVAYFYSVVNGGATRKEVTYALVHSFYAALPILDKNDAIEITSVRDTSQIQWKPLISRGSYYGLKDDERKSFELPSGELTAFRKGGGGTAELDPGERAVGSLALVVRGKPNDLIGFELHLGFEGGKTEDNRWRLEKSEHLTVPDTKATTSTHDVKEENL